eukprot:9469391-Pyramimonas_sp.AAC.1
MNAIEVSVPRCGGGVNKLTKTCGPQPNRLTIFCRFSGQSVQGRSEVAEVPCTLQGALECAGAIVCYMGSLFLSVQGTFLSPAKDPMQHRTPPAHSRAPLSVQGTSATSGLPCTLRALLRGNLLVSAPGRAGADGGLGRERSGVCRG